MDPSYVTKVYKQYLQTFHVSSIHDKSIVETYFVSDKVSRYTLLKAFTIIDIVQKIINAWMFIFKLAVDTVETIFGLLIVNWYMIRN